MNIKENVIMKKVALGISILTGLIVAERIYDISIKSINKEQNDIILIDEDES